MLKSQIAAMIKEAFEEGYYSYSTPASAYNTVEGAWEESSAKVRYDYLMREAKNVLADNM
jgi:hypothetical protein